MPEALTLSTYPLRYVVWPLEIILKSPKFIKVTSQSTGIIVLETWLLRGRQTVSDRINIAQYYPQTAQYIAHSVNIVTGGRTVGQLLHIH